MSIKNKVCLWFDHDAEAAARFYASIFPDTQVTAVHRAPADYPNGGHGTGTPIESVVGPCRSTPLQNVGAPMAPRGHAGERDSPP